MSEEEKKAIENLRKNKGVSFVEADIILNLIKKQQNKIASLQKEIKLMKSININDNYISKDKIREIIKKLEQKIHVVTPDRPIIEKINEFKNEGALNILEKLLEE